MNDETHQPMMEPVDHVQLHEIDAGHDTVPSPTQPRRRRWAGKVFGLLVLLALAGGIAYGAQQHLAEQRTVMATAEKQAEFVPTVHTATVTANDGDIVVTLPGSTSAFTTANIYARASGFIDKRIADIGDHVKEGDLLAEITAPELDHQIDQAQANLTQLEASLRQTQANLELARVTWDRDSPLVKEGWTTPQQGTIDVQNVKALEASASAAEASIAAQRQQIDVLKQEKAYQRVVAPFTGVITQRNVDVGTLVQADAASGTFMYNIMQDDVIRTQVYVPQDQAIGLAPGVAAVVRVPEMPGKTFPGTVTRIADALQPGTRTLLTEIDVPNADAALSSGIYCTVELRIPRKAPSLTVPSTAIIFSGHALSVGVIEDGVVRIRKISVGRDFGTTIEVREGLQPGDQIILSPPVQLADGAKVNAKPEPVAENN